jgi:hypothetical protein
MEGHQDAEMQAGSAALTEQQLEDIVVPVTFSGDVINAVWLLRRLFAALSLDSS